MLPRITASGLSGFSAPGKTSSHLLGVISTGQFSSYFTGRESPLLGNNEQSTGEQNSADQQEVLEQEAPGQEVLESAESEIFTSVIERSPESARIILFSSNEFLNDRVIQIIGSAGGSQYLSALQLIANSVDWSLEDAGLLGIRARSHFNRTLPPMERSAQSFWEYLNYGLALIALAIIAIVQRQRKQARQRHYLAVLVNKES